MSDTIKVCAVDGRLFPYEGDRPGYVGYRAARDNEDADHVIPCKREGKSADIRLVRDGTVDVPNTAYYRRGLGDGDIARVESTPRKKAAADSKVEG